MTKREVVLALDSLIRSAPVASVPTFNHWCEIRTALCVLSDSVLDKHNEDVSTPESAEFHRLERKVAQRDEALSVAAFDLAEAHQAIDDEKAKAEDLERLLTDAHRELDYRATVIGFMATARDEALAERDKANADFVAAGYELVETHAELARTIDARDEALSHLGDACHDRDRLEDELASARAVTRTAEAQVDAIGDRLYHADRRLGAVLKALWGHLPS